MNCGCRGRQLICPTVWDNLKSIVRFSGTPGTGDMIGRIKYMFHKTSGCHILLFTLGVTEDFTFSFAWLFFFLLLKIEERFTATVVMILSVT